MNKVGNLPLPKESFEYSRRTCWKIRCEFRVYSPCTCTCKQSNVALKHLACWLVNVLYIQGSSKVNTDLRKRQIIWYSKRQRWGTWWAVGSPLYFLACNALGKQILYCLSPPDYPELISDFSKSFSNAIVIHIFMTLPDYQFCKMLFSWKQDWTFCRIRWWRVLNSSPAT